MESNLTNILTVTTVLIFGFFAVGGLFLMESPDVSVKKTSQTVVAKESNPLERLDSILYDANKVELFIPISEKEVRLQALKDEIIAMANSEKTRQLEKMKQVKSAKNVSYISDDISKVFHKTDCSFAKRINNEVRFFSKLRAFESGRRACKTCKP